MDFTPVWDAPIAAYLFLAGLGGGAFITSAFVAWKYPEAKTVRRTGRFIAPIVVAVGLVLLMFDARAGFLNPLRFALLLHNLFSVMTWGVIFLAVFEVVAIIVAVMEIMDMRGKHVTVPKWLDLIGVAFGFAVAVYTGVLLGVVRTFPLWNNPLLPILFLVSAVSTGASAVMLTSLIVCPDEYEPMTTLKRLHFSLPIIEMVLLAALLFIVNFESVAAHETVMSLVAGQYAPAFWIGLVGVGLLWHTLYDRYTLFSAKGQERSHRVGEACANGGVLVGGFLLRLLVVLAALPVTVVAVTVA